MENDCCIDDDLKDDKKSKPRATKRIAWSGAFVALCSSWQYGFSIGSINAAHLSMKEAIRSDLETRYDTITNVTEAEVQAIWVASSAAFPVGGTLGAIMLSTFARKFKTLDGLTIGHALTVIFSAVMSLSSVAHSPELLIFGRFGVGFTSALVTTGLSVAYVAEVSPQHLRGFFGTMIGAGISFGILISNSLGLPQVLLSSSSRSQLTCAVTLCASSQITGLNGVAFNMNEIYLRAGMQASYVYYVSIGVCSVVVLLNLVSAKITDKYGRKPLLLFGYAVEAASLLVLAASIETKQFSGIMPYISVVASLGFWVGFSVGPGPLTLITVSEFFQLPARSAGMTIATVFLWLSFTINVVATPYMMDSIRGFTFLPFGILALLALVFIWRFVPETNNISFSEIQKSFLQANAKE